MPGTLFLVGTPIGNLGDITLRALETLRAVPAVVAEDTRRTRALLSHFGVTGKALISCDAHASDASLATVVERLLRGEDVALVTDAGTPSVSDPGARLVRAANHAGVTVSPIPGVSAVTAAVAVSGLVDGPFIFLGFPPRQGAKRREFLGRVVTSLDPSVLFEAPHRVERTLQDLSELAPERDAVLCRELTKLHEEIRRGTLSELAALAEAVRGEVTLVVAAAQPTPPLDLALERPELETNIEQRLRAGASPRSVVDELAAVVALPRRDIYRVVTEVAARLATERA